MVGQFETEADIAAEMASISFASNDLQGTMLVFSPDIEKTMPRVYALGTMDTPRAVAFVVAMAGWFLDRVGDHELAETVSGKVLEVRDFFQEIL